ncbi:MFS transporter [Streptomyces sp. NPDC059743]|uniref:MFS transporter n=1 Tax=Streptomyces sp. NPDC059743 TaxID=3346928 RepID=UPI00365CF1FC
MHQLRIEVPALGGEPPVDALGEGEARIVPVDRLQWVVVGFNVTFASLMLAFGTLADRVGRRRIFLFGISLFSAVVCTFAGSILVLDIARAVGGIGASATLTAGSALITSRFHGHDRVRAFGISGTAIGAGLAFGPLISGAVDSAMGWRGVFAIPAPLGLLVALVARLPVEKRHPTPMFDLSLLRHSRFMGVSLAAMALAFSLLPLLTLLPTYFSAVHVYSARHAGGVLLLFTAPMVLMPMFAGPINRVLSTRTQLIIAMLLVAGGMTWLTVIGAVPAPALWSARCW